MIHLVDTWTNQAPTRLKKKKRAERKDFCHHLSAKKESDPLTIW